MRLKSRVAAFDGWIGLRVALILLAGLVGMAPRVAAAFWAGGRARAILHLNYLASGGEHWKQIGQVVISGALNASGTAGTFRQTVDLRGGRDAAVLDAGPLHVTEVTLPDSSWQLDQGGVVTVTDTPDARIDARNQSFIDRNGWFMAKAAANALKYLGKRREQGRTYDRIALTPEGGRAMTLWFDRDDHLLYRIDELDAAHQPQSFIYSDYRRIQGVLLPFVQRQTNGDARQDVIETVGSIMLSSAVDDGLFVAPASAFHDATLFSSGSSTTVPFELSDGLILIDVSIEGHPALPFILDTGASNIVTPATARQLGLQGTGDIPVGGAGERQTGAQLTIVKELRAGSVELRDQTFAILTMPDGLERPAGEPPVAGFLGAELLRRFPVTIDYQQKTVTFYRPGLSVPRPVGAQIVPLYFNDGHPYVELGIDDVPGIFGLDTGDDGSIALFPSFYEQHRFPVEQPVLANYAVGFGGGLVNLLTRIGSVALGDATIERPLVRLSQTAKGGFSVDAIAGNLGQQFLSNFVFTLDYERHVGYFQRSGAFGKPTDYDRSGLTLIEHGEALIVGRVDGWTPAARAGVRQGDTVLAINGRAAGHTPRGLYRRMLAGPAGSPITLEIRRGNSRRQIMFRLEELLPMKGRFRPLERRIRDRGRDQEESAGQRE